jgi:glycine dehydrogenase
MPDTRQFLSELEQRSDFVNRHIGPRDDDVEAMLAFVGAESLDDLIGQAVPASIRESGALPLASTYTEHEALNYLQDVANKNVLKKSLIGLGYYNTVVPPVILRDVLENPGWYTAYTPYQAEISQGRLETLLSFQQMVMDLTGMGLANASLLDEGTAAAEAMTMLHRVSKKKKNDLFLVDADTHPQTIAVMRTRAEPLGIELEVGDPATFAERDCYGVLLSYPTSSGAVPDRRDLTAKLHEQGALVAVTTDLLALTLLTPPGEWGADCVVGSSQRFGVPLGFGGPHAAFFATHDRHKRSVPGRIIGLSVDADGESAARMALQTREQHIRREKATSNICTAQVLLANMAALYACWHGPDGLETIAARVHRMTAVLAHGLSQLGFAPMNATFFDTLTVHAKDQADDIWQRAADRGLNLRYIDRDHVGVSLDEAVEPEELRQLWQAFAGSDMIGFTVPDLEADAPNGLPKALRRESDFLTHPCFNSYHSETEMMRYLRRLQGRDLALDRAMIPLGSCTMKLNAVSEMEPITWPAFAKMHPFVPRGQAQGYAQLTRELERMLAKLTGFHSVSLQPNSGAQGEYAGLLVIRAWHRANGETQRDKVLIPTSAHGTNFASAKMAGMDVVLVECDEHGNVDVADLTAKADKHADRLAGLMITYPSTHGVFEQAITEICDIVHDRGGQVYLDGANLNALLDVAFPGHFGADVCHMNLHKTFCIPHGGGGPGVGPIGVAEHLAPFLPGHPLTDKVGGDQAIGPVASAPWGSAGILPISWMYITLMGAEGLERATEVAVLNANYIAKRLSAGYDILYSGQGGRVAHECIVDTRPVAEEAGITVDDIAKRLIDYGFHAPTMSWPVPGTLMVEPTESESKAEIDRFCDAMLAIREEARKVARGDWPKDDNPLVNAPHTMHHVTATAWNHPYTREEAAFPSPHQRVQKYWAPVSRVDNVQGDRHLVCSCPPVEAYREAAE